LTFLETKAKTLTAKVAKNAAKAAKVQVNGTGHYLVDRG
jgi:hypothetical protein